MSGSDDLGKAATTHGDAFGGKTGCHLRWSRISKFVELKETSQGLLRGSIAKPQQGKGAGKEEPKVGGDGPATKVILNEVSGEARPGQVLALMGPSGSGKTSLLDALSGRSAYDSGVYTMDSRSVEGPTKKLLKRKIAYIKQADVFFDHLTVRDQLTYTALLRLHGNLTKAEKHAEVDRILTMLRLTKCADTPIMMVSGGERKRVNIGTELLTDPSVVMLDEPTSGLDSTSAVALLGILTDLARTHGKTVVTSIHQPSSAVFQSFDRLLLLADGCMVYFGSPRDSLTYLRGAGYECPPGYNAADHWMDLLVVDSALDGGTMHTIATTSGEGGGESNRPALLEGGGDTGSSNSSDDFADQASPTSSSATEKKRKSETAVPAGTDDSGDEGDEGGSRRRPSLGEKRKSLTNVLNRRRSSMLRRRSSVAKLTKLQRQKAGEGPGSKAALIRAWDNEAIAEEIDDWGANAESKIRRQSDGIGFVDEPTDGGGGGGAVSEENKSKFNTSWLTQFRVLTHRSMKNSRSAIFTPLNLIKSVALGLMCGLLWFQMPYTERTTVDRSSYFFFTMTYWVFDAMFNSLFSFPNERQIIFKERASGSYHLSAYFMAKTTSEAPARLILPAIYMVISYWMAGINPSFAIFLGSTVCCLLSVMAGESMGLLVGATVMDFEKAMVVMVVFSLTLMLGGGYYVDNIPSFLLWLPYLSPFKYAYDASQQIVFDRPVPCDGSGVLEVICGAEDNPGFATPEQVKSFLNIQGSVGFNVGLLLVIFALPRYIAFLSLKRKKGGERS